MSPLETLQLFIGARLESEAYFSDISVFTLRPRKKADGSIESVPNIQTRIDAALNNLTKKADKAGAAVTVFMPTAGVEDPDVAGPEIIVKTIVRVQESPVINMSAGGTRKSAEDIALAVLSALHGWAPIGVATQLNGTKDALRWNDAELPKWTYDVEVETRMALEPARMVATPRLTRAGVLPEIYVTAECETPDAAIYYTRDGSLPWPNNPEAMLYEGPALVSEACTFYAAAYLNGRSGSKPAFLEIT